MEQGIQLTKVSNHQVMYKSYEGGLIIAQGLISVSDAEWMRIEYGAEWRVE